MGDQIKENEAGASSAPQPDAATGSPTPETAPPPEPVATQEAATAADLALQLAQAEAEIARLDDLYRRALAETENVRRRAAREVADAAKYAISGFARDILSVADNLRRAIDSVSAEARSNDKALDAVIAGVEMTEKALLGVFERNGVRPIEAQGQRFDPHIHEAMFEIPDPTVPHGTVLQVVEQGYMIGDRPLRAARVGISKGGPKTEPRDVAEGQAPTGDGVVPFPGKDAQTAYGQPGDRAGAKVDERH
jgi:molecular chaperone GrpE